MAKTLIICGHPDYNGSIANKAILDEMKKLMPEAEIVILSELYPDFKIDVAREQKRLPEAETVVFEYPVQWFDAPSMMHRYVELVFAYGFAYGPGGDALKGKKLILSFTTGAPEKSYTESKYPMTMLMSPMFATAPYVKMEYKGAVISYAMMPANPEDKNSVAKIVDRAKEHAKRLEKLIKE